jgi:hypothetical protein
MEEIETQSQRLIPRMTQAIPLVARSVDRTNTFKYLLRRLAALSVRFQNQVIPLPTAIKPSRTSQLGLDVIRNRVYLSTQDLKYRKTILPAPNGIRSSRVADQTIRSIPYACYAKQNPQNGQRHERQRLMSQAPQRSWPFAPEKGNNLSFHSRKAIGKYYGVRQD